MIKAEKIRVLDRTKADTMLIEISDDVDIRQAVDTVDFWSKTFPHLTVAGYYKSMMDVKFIKSKHKNKIKGRRRFV